MSNTRYSRLFTLMSALHDETIQPNEFVELDRMLASDDRARTIYARYNYMCVVLRKFHHTQANTSIADTSDKSACTMNPDDSSVFQEVVAQDLHDTAIRQALEEAQAQQQALEESITRQRRAIKPRFGRKEMFGGLLRIAAMLAVAVSIIWLDRLLYRANRQEPPVLATVADTLNVRWSIAPEKTTISREELRLEEGFARLLFANGSEVLVEGPAIFACRTEDKLYLHQGKVHAQAPPNVYGFTVETDTFTVMDLGTAFGVDTDEGDAGFGEVQVYDGEVKLFAGNPGSKTSASELLQAGEARRVNTRDKTIEKVEFDRDAFARNWQETHFFVRTSGQVRYSKSIPLDLGYNQYENDETMFLFTERRQFELPQALPVLIPDVTGMRTSQFVDKTLPAGTRVDCYLLHVDLKETPQKRSEDTIVFLEGQLQFNRPILGLIVTGEKLNETDALLGNATTIYSQQSKRGILSQTDWFILSDDRRTLDIELNFKNTEEMRILVASE
ncbi:MAG: FecR domain-containing protein [Sedimentisphaerales bacterium]|nr:FecR domain-containing protein [Sedimentisphaerales bacterium]